MVTEENLNGNAGVKGHDEAAMHAGALPEGNMPPATHEGDAATGQPPPEIEIVSKVINGEDTPSPTSGQAISESERVAYESKVGIWEHALRSSLYSVDVTPPDWYNDAVKAGKEHVLQANTQMSESDFRNAVGNYIEQHLRDKEAPHVPTGKEAAVAATSSDEGTQTRVFRRAPASSEAPGAPTSDTPNPLAQSIETALAAGYAATIVGTAATGEVKDDEVKKEPEATALSGAVSDIESKVIAPIVPVAVPVRVPQKLGNPKVTSFSDLKKLTIATEPETIIASSATKVMPNVYQVGKDGHIYAANTVEFSKVNRFDTSFVKPKLPQKNTPPISPKSKPAAAPLLTRWENGKEVYYREFDPAHEDEERARILKWWIENKKQSTFLAPQPISRTPNPTLSGVYDVDPSNPANILSSGIPVQQTEEKEEEEEKSNVLSPEEQSEAIEAYISENNIDKKGASLLRRLVPARKQEDQLAVSDQKLSPEQIAERKERAISSLNEMGKRLPSLRQVISVADEDKKSNSDKPRYTKEEIRSAVRERNQLRNRSRDLAMEIAGPDALFDAIKTGDIEHLLKRKQKASLPPEQLALVNEAIERRRKFYAALPGVNTEASLDLYNEFLRNAKKLESLSQSLNELPEGEDYHATNHELHLLRWYNIKPGSWKQVAEEVKGLVEAHNTMPPQEAVVADAEQVTAQIIIEKGDFDIKYVSCDTLHERMRSGDDETRALAEAEWERRALRISKRKGNNRELKQALLDIKSGNGAKVPEKWLMEFQTVPVIGRYYLERKAASPAAVSVPDVVHPVAESAPAAKPLPAAAREDAPVAEVSVEKNEQIEKKEDGPLDLSIVLSTIESSLLEQPEPVRLAFEQLRSKWEKAERIDGKVFVFAHSLSGYAVPALVSDEVDSNKFHFRTFRASSSDAQWKAVPGMRADDWSYMKGDENDANHHYVQSAKLDKRVYQAIDTLSEIKMTEGDMRELIPRQAVGGGWARYGEEFTFKEDQIELKNPEWKSYQVQAQRLYDQYDILQNRKTFDRKAGAYILVCELADTIDEFAGVKQLYDRILDGDNSDEVYREFQDLYHLVVQQYLEKQFASLVPPEGMVPSFLRENIVDTYTKKDLSPDGKEDKPATTIEEYKSTTPEGDELVWAMAHDGEGRVYIDNIYDPRVGISDYGTIKSIANMGMLVYKPKDYTDSTAGIPDKYKKPVFEYVTDKRVDPPQLKEQESAHYADISAFLEILPPIKAYKDAIAARLEASVGVPHVPEAAVATPAATELSPEDKARVIESLRNVNAELDPRYKEISEKREILASGAAADDAKKPAALSDISRLTGEIEEIKRASEEGALSLFGAEKLRSQIKLVEGEFINTSKDELVGIDRSKGWQNQNRRAEYRSAMKRKNEFLDVFTTQGIDRMVAAMLYQRMGEDAQRIVQISGIINKLIAEGGSFPHIDESDSDFALLRKYGVPEEFITGGKLEEIAEIISLQAREYTHTPLQKPDGTPREMVIKHFINATDKYQFETYAQFSDYPEIQSAAIEKVHSLITNTDTEAIRVLPEWVNTLMKDDAAYIDFCKNMPPAPVAPVTRTLSLEPKAAEATPMYAGERSVMLNDPSISGTQKLYLEHRHEILDSMREAQREGNDNLVTQFEGELERMNAWYNAAIDLGGEEGHKAATVAPNTMEAIAPVGDAYWSAFDKNLSPVGKKFIADKTKGMTLEPMTPGNRVEGVFDASAVPLTERAKVSGEVPVLTDRNLSCRQN